MPTPRLALLITCVAALGSACDEKGGGSGGGAGAGAGPGAGGDEGAGDQGAADEGAGDQGAGDQGAGDEGAGDQGGADEGAGAAGAGDAAGEGEGEGQSPLPGEGEGEGEGEGGGEGEGEGEGEPGPAACGGIAGLICPAPETEFCSYPRGECGLDDGLGECRGRPEFCAQDCPRVCGCDGRDYCNECIAAANGISTLHRGECGQGPPEPPNDCVLTDHPSVTVVGEGAECQVIRFACEDGQQMYQDACSCGCIDAGGSEFACEVDADCVPEDCCRPTGCVNQEARECDTPVCCECDDCRPAVTACGCVAGLCRTQLDHDACE